MDVLRFVFHISFRAFDRSCPGDAMTTALLALTLCAGLTGDTPANANLDFSTGRLTGWEGEGFLLMPKSGTDPAYVTSADRAKPGHTALLHRSFEVPKRAGVLRF